MCSNEKLMCGCSAMDRRWLGVPVQTQYTRHELCWISAVRRAYTQTLTARASMREWALCVLCGSVRMPLCIVRRKTKFFSKRTNDGRLASSNVPNMRRSLCVSAHFSAVLMLTMALWIVLLGAYSLACLLARALPLPLLRLHVMWMEMEIRYVVI